MSARKHPRLQRYGNHQSASKQATSRVEDERSDETELIERACSHSREHISEMCDAVHHGTPCA
jgi:hypothetical protein